MVLTLKHAAANGNHTCQKQQTETMPHHAAVVTMLMGGLGSSCWLGSWVEAGFGSDVLVCSNNCFRIDEDAAFDGSLAVGRCGRALCMQKIPRGQSSH